MRFSTLLYIFEPDVNVDSMFTAMWVSTVTVTTVGYGDITPITLSGKMPLCLALSDGRSKFPYDLLTSSIFPDLPPMRYILSRFFL